MKSSHPRLSSKLTKSIIVGAFFILFVLILTGRIIGGQVSNICLDSNAKNSGDCPGYLMSLLVDETNDYQKRNSAVWALGQLGDIRAIPVLKRYYTAVIPRRESLDQTLSQYELKKAISLLESGFNITAVFWRGRF